MIRGIKQLRYILILLLLTLSIAGGCSNPFAPALDQDLNPSSTLLGDQTTIDGVFQNVQYAYTYRDTLIYGELLHPDFEFRYFDPERGLDQIFNRDEEMRVTWNLFRGADQIDLKWTSIYSQDGDSTLTIVTRGYNLRITLQASETFIIEGLATLRLTRENPNDVWRIRLWRDDSNG
ncbi:MAG: hypothetical protein KDD67_04675 [Ignavibacteriae bacterium]|nr:hypothetical protein [Ignavibacteriota bacterium]MCB9216375.1 hypothetical protein [Ignavibacteria bacterium]